MLKHELLKDEGILIIEPQGSLKTADFAELVKDVDPYLEEKHHLNGLLIYAEAFPGWSDFAAFLSHIKFIKNHHQKIHKVAAVTDDGFLAILPKVAAHFVAAEIKHFPFAKKAKALSWIKMSED